MKSPNSFFSAIEGHEQPVRILTQALANKTLAHAYLFSGGKGVGKKMTAFALAAALNCQAAEPDGGCGVCPSCRKIALRSHPDVHLLEPDGDDIKIDQIREVQDYLALKPFEGTKKVLVVNRAENLNQASSNAFLKTLEEPPGDSLIILVSSLPQSLLATIRSRCQEIKFRSLPRRTLSEVFIKKRELSEENAWFLSALAQGSIGRGLEMDVERERADREEIMAFLSDLSMLNIAEAIAHAEAVSKDRERLERLLDLGIERFRDAVVFRLTGDSARLVYALDRERCSEWEERFSLQKLLVFMELFMKSRVLLGRHVSAQLVAENLFLKLGEG